MAGRMAGEKPVLNKSEYSPDSTQDYKMASNKQFYGPVNRVPNFAPPSRGARPSNPSSQGAPLNNNPRPEPEKYGPWQPMIRPPSRGMAPPSSGSASR